MQTEFIEKIGAEYQHGPPKGLGEQVVAIVEHLVQEGIVKLSAEPFALPPYLLRPLFEQEPAVYRQQMLADGFIEPPATPGKDG